MHLYLAWKIVTVSTYITICVTATQCLGFQGHPTQQKMFPPLFNGSLIISKSISPSPLSLSLVPISLLPLDNQNPPTAHGKTKKWREHSNGRINVSTR